MCEYITVTRYLVYGAGRKPLCLRHAMLRRLLGLRAGIEQTGGHASQPFRREVRDGDGGMWTTSEASFLQPLLECYLTQPLI